MTASIIFLFFEKITVIAIDLDMLSSLVFGLPAVQVHEAASDLVGRRGVIVAVESAVHVVRADVGNRGYLDIFRVDRADQYATFVPGAENGHTKWLIDFAIAVIVWAESVAGSEVVLDALLEKSRLRSELPRADGSFPCQSLFVLG